MLFNRYEVRARHKDNIYLDGAYTPRYTLKKSALDWASDLTRRHFLIFGHRDIEYYVFDRKLKQEVCVCLKPNCTYVRNHS